MKLIIDSKINVNQEHYKLLSCLVNQLPDGSKVIDLGTYRGLSAEALSVNPNVRVFSYDICDSIPEGPRPSNVTYILKNCLECIEDFIDSELILLDISPHDGEQENKIIEGLIRLKYKGILILDDIFWGFTDLLLVGKDPFGMQKLWNSIEIKKIDATKWGHYTGSGIMIFDPEYIDVEVK